MARTLPTSIAIAMTAHAIVIVGLQGGHTPALALGMVAEEEPGEAPSTPITNDTVEPFAIEFVMLPPAASTAPIPNPVATAKPRTRRTARVARPQLRIQDLPTQPPTPTPTVAGQKLTKDVAPSTGLLQGPEKQPSSPSLPGRYSLSMRPNLHPGVDGRTGSLLDDAIGSVALPSIGAQTRSDLIVGEARIGLDSQATRTTRWRETGGGSMTSVGEPFTADIASDGTIRFRDHDNVNAELLRWRGIPMPMVVGKFDLTDAALAAFGEVLYPFRKLKAMDQTREYRASLALRARGKSLQAALRRFRRDLKKIWADRSLRFEERRAILFALWDECAEEGPEEVTKTAASIRAIVLHFVARELAADSEHAFTPEELSKLNAQRQSEEEFAPYTLSAP